MSQTDNVPCTVCGETDTQHVVDIDDVPVYCNVLYDSREDALAAARGNVHLSFCPHCGHVFNTAFRSELLDYTQEYENSLHHSPRFQQYAQQLAADLVRRHNLKDKTIVEIACGKGDFLRLLCETGGNQGYGFDPSYEPPSAGATESDQITFVNEYYGPTDGVIDADFICCRHALEHIETPTAFLRTIRESIRHRPGPTLFFEVPNSLYSFRDMGIWDLIYEHPSYFCAKSLSRAFELAGFQLSRIHDSFHGQFLCAEAVTAWPGDGALVLDRPLGEGLQNITRKFEQDFRQKVDYWNNVVAEWRISGKNVTVWGAGSKGVTFLNTLSDSSIFKYVVDMNPRKQRKFIPGTAQEVIAPKTLQHSKPDVVVVMNPAYVAEIKQLLSKMCLRPDMLVA